MSRLISDKLQSMYVRTADKDYFIEQSKATGQNIALTVAGMVEYFKEHEKIFDNLAQLIEELDDLASDSPHYYDGIAERVNTLLDYLNSEETPDADNA